MQDLATEDMARIVSRVTEPVLGMTFVAAVNGDAAVGDAWKTAVLPINGTDPLTVAVSADDGSWKHHYLRAGALNLVLAIATRIY